MGFMQLGRNEGQRHAAMLTWHAANFWLNFIMWHAATKKRTEIHPWQAHATLSSAWLVSSHMQLHEAKELISARGHSPRSVCILHHHVQDNLYSSHTHSYPGPHLPCGLATQSSHCGLQPLCCMFPSTLAAFLFSSFTLLKQFAKPSVYTSWHTDIQTQSQLRANTVAWKLAEGSSAPV